ncbi:hypothetical protein FACS1894180_3590 [Bacteroidia bacterium]|nr:hypothetical protein FACS1894180_3590 [Bacteroidia bacterium]
MKKLFVIIFLIFWSNAFCSSEDSIKPHKNIQHNLFLELGVTSMYSITYDCSFPIAEKHKIAVAAGFQYTYFPVKGYLFIPHTFGTTMQVNYLYGHNHHLEIGMGITFPSVAYYEKQQQKWLTNNHVVIPLRIGYRYQRENGGLFWKIAFVPLFGEGMYFPVGKEGKIPFFPSFGVSIGYTFKNKRR